MRIDAKALGVGTILIIIGVLIGFFARQCPADGNPVGFKLAGKVLLSNSKFDPSCSTGKTCTLSFDIRTSETSALTSAGCGSSNCFHFKDDGASGDKWSLDMKDAGGQHPTYYDYVDGTVTVSSTSRPTPRH